MSLLALNPLCALLLALAQTAIHIGIEGSNSNSATSNVAQRDWQQVVDQVGEGGGVGTERDG